MGQAFLASKLKGVNSCTVNAGDITTRWEVELRHQDTKDHAELLVDSHVLSGGGPCVPSNAGDQRNSGGHDGEESFENPMDEQF